MNRDVVSAALDSIGRDTQTARLIAAKDYEGAYKHLTTVVHPQRWGSGQVAGGTLGEKQKTANQPRVDSYLALHNELAAHLGITT